MDSRIQAELRNLCARYNYILPCYSLRLEFPVTVSNKIDSFFILKDIQEVVLAYSEIILISFILREKV